MDGRASPFTPRGRRGRVPFSMGAGWSPSPGFVADFTPSPIRGGHRGRGFISSPSSGHMSSPNRSFGSSPGQGFNASPGRGFNMSPGRGFSPRGRGARGSGGGGAGLVFDEMFMRFATENPWAELEVARGLKSSLGPLNSGENNRNKWHVQAPSPVSGGANLPPPDDDDSFV